MTEVSGRATRLLLVALSLLVVSARAPILFRHPRFWAEEAVVYFRRAWEEPWPVALVTPQNGYLSLFNNIAAVLAATLVPLEHAPLVTTLAALLAQLAPIVIILFGRIPLFDGLPRQAVAVLIVLLTPPSAEIWLNTINSQFYLALAACLLLLEDGETPSRAGRVLRRGLLALAGLTGPVSCFLAPLAVHRAWVMRRRESTIQAAILCAAAVLQISILGMMGERSTAADRLGSLDPSTMAAILTTRTLAEPLLGGGVGARISTAIVLYRDASAANARDLGVVLAGGLAAVLTFLLWRRRDLATTMLTGGYLLIAVLSIVGSLGHDKAALIPVYPANGGRYFYVPGVLGSLLVLSAIRWGPRTFNRVRAVLCGALLLFSLVTNARHFRSDLPVHPAWPRWTDEVASWRRDASHELRVWPPGWSLKLDPG